MVRLVELWKGSEVKKVLDLGTGSGAIALGLASQLSSLLVVAVDKSEEALELAKRNGERCELGDRVSFLESDWFDKVEGKYDWVVSNPPYLTDEEWESAEPEVREFEPRSALTAEDEGLKDLKKILEGAKSYLTDGGGVALETGIAQHAALKEYAEGLGYRSTESWKDLSERDRYFIATL